MCLEKVQAYLYRGRSFNKYLTTCVCEWGIGVLYLISMDYLVGFLFGYFCKYFISSLKDIANGNIFQYNYEYIDLDPLTEDDLP